MTFPPGRARLGDEPRANGIDAPDHDDRDRGGCLTGRDRRRIARRHDDIHLEGDQLGCERGTPLGLSVGEPGLDARFLSSA